MKISKSGPLPPFTTFITLLFLSTVIQYVIFVAYFPFFLFGLIAALFQDSFNLLGLDSTMLLLFLGSTLLFILLTYLFNKYFLEQKGKVNNLSFFFAVLAVNLVVHYAALLNKAFIYFMIFLSVLAYLQIVTILHAKKHLLSKDYSSVMYSMIFSVICSFIVTYQVSPNQYIWIGESIMKLTSNQFNIFWFDYGGFAFIYLSLLTSFLYFIIYYGINTIKKN